jgi:5'-deoxynucleotidase YfbR-like HD superfamily hydrolase
MANPHPLLFSLQRMINDLSLIERKHYHPEAKRRENDIEHSMAVAVLCWYVHDKYAIDLDIAKILKYALTHDFVERYAGDVPTFASSTERNEKVLREQESLIRLSEEFREFDDMVTSMQKYEKKEDEESLFVWSVDKIQQLIMGDLDDWSSYAEAPITYDQFVAKYKELSEKSSRYCREIFEGLLEHSKSTYYDQPESR